MDIHDVSAPSAAPHDVDGHPTIKDDELSAENKLLIAELAAYWEQNLGSMNNITWLRTEARRLRDRARALQPRDRRLGLDGPAPLSRGGKCEEGGQAAVK